MKDLHSIVKRPLLTEKSNSLTADLNQVTFEVGLKCSKTEIKTAVEKLFKVEVDSINTSIVHGKVKTVGRNRGRQGNWKKAVVRLKEGHTLEFFEGV